MKKTALLIAAVVAILGGAGFIAFKRGLLNLGAPNIVPNGDKEPVSPLDAESERSNSVEVASPPPKTGSSTGVDRTPPKTISKKPGLFSGGGRRVPVPKEKSLPKSGDDSISNGAGMKLTPFEITDPLTFNLV